MASKKKLELIIKTHEMLKTKSPEELSIRTIAAACDCTGTVVYKHFENLDHLLLIASVRFLENYVIELEAVLNSNTDSLEMLYEMWRVFAKYAFANVEVFELLFWGKYKDRLSDAIFEYYQIFPEKWENLDGLFTSIFFNNDLKERNYIMQRRTAAMGYFAHKDLRMLSDMECDLFHGVMLNYRRVYREPGKAEEGADCFMGMLESLFEHYRIK